MKKKRRTLKKILLIISIIIIVLICALLIYASNYSHAEDAMYDQIESMNITEVTRYEDSDEISFTVAEPLNNIVFIPGGKVEPSSYEYLAVSLANAGNNVTIYKPFLNLAIFTPNHAKRFLDEELNNIVIGHSLGGIVGSMLSSKNNLVSQVILLGSYPIKDITDKEVLIIAAEFDIAMNTESFEESLVNVSIDYELFNIEGANHAQFGWYGVQKGDGVATISTLEQQDIVINKILEFIRN